MNPQSASFVYILLLAAVLLAIGVLLFWRLRRPAGKQMQTPPMTAARMAETAMAAPAMAAPAAPPADTPSPFVAAPADAADDLSRIKGIGPKLSAQLATLGVYTFAQIAAWTPDQLAVVDAGLGQFSGRPQRDRWQEQAALLATGDTAGFEALIGRLAE